MHPAFSVIFLTTLIGAGQGLFLALFTGQLYALAKLLPVQEDNFYVWGSLIALALLVLPLLSGGYWTFMLGVCFANAMAAVLAWEARAPEKETWGSRFVGTAIASRVSARLIAGIVVTTIKTILCSWFEQHTDTCAKQRFVRETL